MSKAMEQTLFLYLNSVQNKPPFLLVIKRRGVESLSSHNYLRLHFLMLHDLDYFLLRYGPIDVAKYVKDDSTVSKYYGTLSFYQ